VLAEEADASKKKGAKAQKEYVPKKGTANYAILICMFRATHQGQRTFGKKELMSMVEASQLATKSMYAAAAGGAVQNGQIHKAYDGWSCMQVSLLLSLLCYRLKGKK
jgi:crossover junction endonuclease MUS81